MVSHIFEIIRAVQDPIAVQIGMLMRGVAVMVVVFPGRAVIMPAAAVRPSAMCSSRDSKRKNHHKSPYSHKCFFQ